jgi:CheY-like chemotaxis protein
MTLSALLVCLDRKAAEVLQRVLKELSIRVEACPDFARAAMRAVQQRFDVIVVDGSAAEVTTLLRETRSSRKNDATLAVAVVPSQESIRELFSLGVNFVLYKPVAYERALSSLEAARAVMRKDKRKDLRAAVHTHATIDYANVQQENATLVDLGHHGMAVLFGKKLPPTSKVYFQFKLPGQNMNVRLSGLVVWQDWNGRGGVQFVDVPKASRRLLDEFLGANASAQASRPELPEVTVEVEEPWAAGKVSVAETRQESKNERPPASALAAASETRQHSESAAAVQVEDANNRRLQVRYSCRLGAEVYRTGTSVPNHCCLTDLSSGGCYLEVPLPFPQGSSIEILVRTYELKLRLRGTVLTSHPGYGMGIGFELKTKEEQANVRKLTEFVASTTNPS